VTGITEPAQRDVATAAVTALAVQAGVRIIRVHDVSANRQAADVTFAMMMNRKDAFRPDTGPAATAGGQP